MKIKTSEFVISCVMLDKCPNDKAEFAFIGRSNVGKSSLINMLTDRKNLAHTSSTPGKTQTINYFNINEDWYIVDLPGYGYAKTGKRNRDLFSKIIRYYILNAPNLMNVFVLIDSRIPPQEADLDFVYNLGVHEIPFVLVFTKIDKISKNKVGATVEAFKKRLSENWEEMPKMILSSSVSKTGQKEILDFISETKTLFTPPEKNQ
jgi:GTP-binding protein